MHYYRAGKIILIFKYLKLIGQCVFTKIIQNDEIFIKNFKFSKNNYRHEIQENYIDI